jgi:hypothetical protein
MAQKIPQNQLDALPLPTDTTSNGGEVYNVGNTMVRYWSPSDTGIGGVALTVDPGDAISAKTYLLTNWLDVRGCSAFQGVLTRKVQESVPGAGDAAAQDSVTPFVMNSQYKSGTGVQPPTGVLGITLAGASPLSTITPVAKPAALAYPWTYVTSRGLQFAAVNPSLLIGVLGFNVRLWFSRNAPTVYPGELYTLELWGTSQ